jgi:transcriptional regulator with XRE-family HTH domain
MDKQNIFRKKQFILSTEMSRKKYLTEWREDLGFNQQNLADYFGISRSQLSMIEQGERELPTQTLLQFNELVLAYEQAKAMPQPAEWIVQGRQKALEVLQRETKTLEYEIYIKQRELDAHRQTYQQVRSRLQTLMILQGNLKKDSEQAYQHQLWLDIQLHRTNKQFEKLPYESIVLAQVNLESMQQRLQLIRTQISNLEGSEGEV